MTDTAGLSIALALRRLRICITVCCWVIGLSLVAQAAAWSMATFTDLRVEVIEPEFDQPLVVTTEQTRRQIQRPVTSNATSFADVIEPVPVRTAYDRFFHDMTSVSTATGTLACLVLMPVLMVAAVLVSARPTARVHHVISALIWMAIVGALALPLDNVLALPWQDGAFHNYQHMVRDIDAHASGSFSVAGFYGRYLILPLFCAAGVFLVGWRFSRGVDALMPEELPHQLNPELERETSNIRPGTLHGGRAAAALQRSVGSTEEAGSETPGPPQTQNQQDLPNARSVSAGQPLKRLI